MVLLGQLTDSRSYFTQPSTVRPGTPDHWPCASVLRPFSVGDLVWSCQIIERIKLGYAGNPMRVFISLTALSLLMDQQPILH